MNDDQLGRRLHDELNRRIDAPDTAPEAVHDHLRNLRSMQEPRTADGRGPSAAVRGLFGIAAAVVVVALAAAVLLSWRSGTTGLTPSSPVPSGHGSPAASPSANASPSTAVSPSAAAILNAAPITSIGRVDAKVGWVFESDDSSASYVRLTEDGGASWSEPRNGPPGGAQGMQFVDARHGWAFSGGGLDEASPTATISRTTDGGLTWHQSSVAFGSPALSGTGTFELVSVHFRDSLHGELFTVHGPNGDAAPAPSGAAPSAAATICQRFSSPDGGLTWLGPAQAPCLADVTFVDASFGYALDGETAEFSGRVHVTTDGGRTWVTGTLPAPPTAYKGFVVMGRVAFVERRSDGSLRALCVWTGSQKREVTVGVSRDGGRTWTDTGPVQDFDTLGGTPTAVAEGRWIVLDSQLRSANPDYIYGTSDGGKTWSSVPTKGLPSGTLIGAQFVDAANGWAAMNCSTDGAEANPNAKNPCGSSGFAVFATTDGAATWTRVFTP